MTNNIDTLILAPWIIPIQPAQVVLKDHALAINKGRIAALLPQRQAEETFEAKQVIRLEEHALLPGLVNAHTHSPMVYFRGLGDDMELMDWLTSTIWPAEKEWLGPEFITDATELAILEMLKSGTTCFNEHYLFPGYIAEVTKRLGMRAAMGLFMIETQTAYADRLEDCLKRAEEILQAAAQEPHNLIHYTIAPHSPYALSDQALLDVKHLASKYHLPIYMHVQESETEIEMSLKEHGKRPLQRLKDLGLLEHHFQHVHMVQLDDADLKILTETKGHVIHCPQSNLKLASGICQTQRLLEAGINVALGTDGAASNNDLDMFAEMRTAALLAKAANKNPTSLPAYQALEMATLNGAKAMGLEDEIGSLEVGKAADVIAVDLSEANTQPLYHPISQLAYAVNSRQVSDVWVAGKQLVKNKTCVALDEKSILSKTKQWGMRIYQPLNSSPTRAEDNGLSEAVMPEVKNEF